MDISRIIAIRDQIDDLIDLSTEAEPGEETANLTDGVAELAADKPVLGIVVGHTRIAPGATGIAPISSSEYPWNLDLAAKIKVVGTAQGVDVRVRLRDRVGISGAYASIAQVNPKAVVELHFNASNGAARGTETLYAFQQSRAWAQALQDEMVRVYNRQGTANRGLKKRTSGDRGYGSVSQLPNVPSALIEPFFGDNSNDANLGQDNKQELAEAIVAAFLRI